VSRVLVVEDEPRIAHFLGKALRLDGHDVVVAEDGEVALFLAMTEPFDLAVLDLTLPGRSGLDVLVELHRDRPALPVMMLTGRDDPAARRACAEAGAVAFLAKPLVVDDLREQVRALLPST
jgi:DNA-binding response OmpR family regulator